MKKHHITINPSVYKKLEEIFSHIALESLKTALDIIDDIEKKHNVLRNNARTLHLNPRKNHLQNLSNPPPLLQKIF